MKPDRPFRSSAARLAFVYGTVVLLLVVALQGTVFLLTRSALQREIHAIVSAELEDLAEDYDNGGMVSLVSVLRSHTDNPVVLPGGVDHRSALTNRQRRGLLDIYILAGFTSHDRRNRVPVVRSGDMYCVHILHL